MCSEGACYPFYRPNVGMVAVFDFDADCAVLLVERLYVTFDEGKDLVETAYVSGDIPSQKIL